MSMQNGTKIVLEDNNLETIDNSNFPPQWCLALFLNVDP